MYDLTISLRLTPEQLSDADDWLTLQLASVAVAIQAYAPQATRAPVTGDDGSPIGEWRITRPVCSYPPCGADSVRQVDDRLLCGQHASEYEDYLSGDGAPDQPEMSPEDLAECERQAARGELAGAPETMPCYECGGFFNGKPDSEQPQRRVVALGPILEARRDPTSSYRLECGHLAF